MNAFPAEAFRALLDYTGRMDGRWPLLTSSAWRLPASDVEPPIVRKGDQIYWLADEPKWLVIGKPPFIDRDLQGWERHALTKLVKNGDLLLLNDPIHNSIGESGGGAKCSWNPFYHSIWVSNDFPRTDFNSTEYKLIRILSAPMTFPKPTCVFDDPNPRGFFKSAGDTYRSSIEIDEVHGMFVRPDGTFWLHLSDGDWYRFRRDMSSDAPEIGTKYHVMRERAFAAVRDKASTLQELEAALLKDLPFGR